MDCNTIPNLVPLLTVSEDKIVVSCVIVGKFLEVVSNDCSCVVKSFRRKLKCLI